jgi:hypothetical protein
MRKSESRVSSFGNAIFVKPKEHLSYDAAHYECAEVEQISAPEISRRRAYNRKPTVDAIIG